MITITHVPCGKKIEVDPHKVEIEKVLRLRGWKIENCEFRNSHRPTMVEIRPAGTDGRRDHLDIPFNFQGYGHGYVRLLGPTSGIPPTIVVVSDRQVEVEVVLKGKV